MDNVKELFDWVYMLVAGAFATFGYFLRRAMIKQDEHDERIREIERRYVPNDKLEERMNRMQSALSAEIKEGHRVIRDENTRMREDIQYIRKRVDEK